MKKLFLEILTLSILKVWGTAEDFCVCFQKKKVPMHATIGLVFFQGRISKLVDCGRLGCCGCRWWCFSVWVCCDLSPLTCVLISPPCVCPCLFSSYKCTIFTGEFESHVFLGREKTLPCDILLFVDRVSPLFFSRVTFQDSFLGFCAVFCMQADAQGMPKNSEGQNKTTSLTYW